MGAAIWHPSPTAAPTKPPTLLMPLTRTSRKAAESSRSFALRLQRVDGRRFDALVADILCSRLHGVAATTVSYVSAPLVRRASVHLCECVCACARCCRCVWVCLRVCRISCAWVHASSHAGQRARTVEPSHTGYWKLRELVQRTGLVFALAEGTDNPCSRAVMILLQLSSGHCQSHHRHYHSLS